MKVGDVVRPKMSCSGMPGAARCTSALVLLKTLTKVKIFCSCGTSTVPRHTLESFVIEPEIAYSADPI